MSESQTTESGVPNTLQTATVTHRGRWIWGTAIFLIACVAQGILWAMWWEDPTHFKMSILFVWPAALFLLTTWWVFFSGWSRLVRFGSVAIVVASVASFLTAYRLEWDGDMVPRRFVLRSKPRAEDLARQFLKEHSPVPTEPKEQPGDAPRLESSILVAGERDWPGFRGPKRDGIVRGGSLRRDWQSSPPRELWRHPVGRGWSAFCVVGDRAFTQEQRDENECVVAYDVEKGIQVWVHEDKTILSIVDANGGPGPHATPQFDDGLIYTLGGTGMLNCLDATTGHRIWSTNILKYGSDTSEPGKTPEWGVSNSPLIVENLVIVIPGGSQNEENIAFNKGVAAYDKKTGKLKWAAGKRQASYASPTVEMIGGTKQVLIPNVNGLSGHSVETGEELWFYPLQNAPKVNSSMPWLLDDDSLLFGTGYGIGSVRIDISHSGDQWAAKKRWASNRFRPKFNDFVVYEGHAYGLDDGTLSCLDVQDGTIKWKSGRYGYGQILLVDDIMIVISEDGDLMLIPASPKKPEPLASVKELFKSGFCWNHLALVRGRLFARNANEAVCLDVAAKD